MWDHSKMLRPDADTLCTAFQQCKRPHTVGNNISFDITGEKPQAEPNWQLYTDYGSQLKLPECTARTPQRPDLVSASDLLKQVVLWMLIGRVEGEG